MPKNSNITTELNLLSNMLMQMWLLKWTDSDPRLLESQIQIDGAITEIPINLLLKPREI